MILDFCNILLSHFKFYNNKKNGVKGLNRSHKMKDKFLTKTLLNLSYIKIEEAKGPVVAALHREFGQGMLI